MFAALANHTGGVALQNTYWSDPPAQWIFEFWFGGNPFTHPFEFERSSLLNVAPGSTQVLPSNDLARNLTHVPIRSYRALGDPIFYLVQQTYGLDVHLQSLGATSELVDLNASIHDWDTIDETEICDWLDQHELHVPSKADTLADRDGIYFHFFVEQDAPGAFTPFTWILTPAQNRVDLIATENLKRITVDVHSAGIDPTQVMKVGTGSADGLADQVLIPKVPAAPSLVLRDGQVTTLWNWDPLTHVLSLDEVASGYHLYEIQP